MWSERGLAIADVREGPRVGEGPGSCKCQRGTSGKCRGKVRGFLLGPAIVQLVCRVCYLLKMLLMRWDTYHDLDKGQNMTTLW